MTNRNNRITFRGLAGYISMGMGLLFVGGTIAAWIVNYENSAGLATLFYGVPGALLLYGGYQLHYPRLKNWKRFLGFAFLVAGIFITYFFVMEIISLNITDRLHAGSIIGWLLLIVALVFAGYHLVKPLFNSASAKKGLLLLVSGLIIIATSFSGLMYNNPIIFALIAIPGFIMAFNGYRLMRHTV